MTSTADCTFKCLRDEARVCEWIKRNELLVKTDEGTGRTEEQDRYYYHDLCRGTTASRSTL